MKDVIPLKQYIWRSPGAWSIVLSIALVEIVSKIQAAGYFSGVKAGTVYLFGIPLILILGPWLVILFTWRGSTAKPQAEAILFSLIGTILFLYTLLRYISP